MFKEKLRAALDVPGAIRQVELARRAGCSPGLVTGILKGRINGSEAVRRRIAAVIGMSYEEMIGVSAPVALDRMKATRIPVSKVPGMQGAAEKMPPGSELVMMPIVTVSAVLAGRCDDFGADYLGCFAAVGALPGAENLVAVHAPDDTMVPDIARGDVLVVDRRDTLIRDGSFYLCGPPVKTPVRQLYRDGASVVAVSMDKKIKPHVILADAVGEVICGRVVSIYGDKAAAGKTEKKKG